MSPRELDVVGLGFSSLDVVGLVPALPELDRGVPLIDITRQGGGPVAQAMVTIARLGGRAGYIGRLADDAAGQTMYQDLQANGVDLAQVQFDPGTRSPECMILVHQPTGHRSICCYRGSNRGIDISAVDENYLTSGKMLHLDGIDFDAARWAAQRAHARGTPVCLDAGGPNPPLLDLLPYIDVLIAAEAFVEDIAECDDIEAGARALHALGPRIVVVTRGSKGSYSLIGDESFYIDSFVVDVVDTTGAGDVFHGAYIFGLLQGWDHRAIARFAGATAALKCRKLGGRAGIPTLDEVMDFLKNHG